MRYQTPEADSSVEETPGDTSNSTPAGNHIPPAVASARLQTPQQPPETTPLKSARATPTDAIRRVLQTYPHGSTRQVNCAFFGRQGNGKSSLINTVYQTVTDSNDNLCEVGYGSESKTVKYACCAELDFKKLLPLVFFDTKGLSDSSDRSYVDLVQTILKGKFKPNHSMNKPKWTDYRYLPNQRMQINVIVFVYAYGTPFPQRLASAVAAAAFVSWSEDDASRSCHSGPSPRAEGGITCEGCGDFPAPVLLRPAGQGG